MKRSARSTPTGPGSRGGTIPHSKWRHRDGAPTTLAEQVAWDAYHRAWRARHPDYRERERRRLADRRRAAQLEADRRWVDELRHPTGLLSG